MKNEQKKEYRVPEMKQVKLKHRAKLLDGSLTDPKNFLGGGN